MSGFNETKFKPPGQRALELVNSVNAQVINITQQTKLFRNKNTLREYMLESFKANAEFTATNATINAQDTTNYKTGTSALSFTTTTAGTAGSVVKTVAWNLSSATNFALDCYVADNTKIQAISIYFLTTGSAMYNEVKAGFINGWNHFRWDKTDMGVSGSPTWANITQVKIEVTPVAGQNATIVIDALKKDAFDPPKMVFCFDDGLASVYNTVYPLFASRGYKFSACVYKSAVDTGGHVTTAQLKEIYAAGNDVLNHSETHPNMSSMTYTAVAQELQNMREWQYSNGFTRGLDIIVYPNNYTPIAKQVAKDLGFNIGRDATITGYNYGATGDLLWLKAFLTDTTVTPTSINTRINRLVRAGGTMFTYCHDVVDTGATGSQTPTSIIQQMLDACATYGITVMTLSQWEADLSS